MSIDDFRFAGGSTVGWEHHRLRRNSQDALHFDCRDGYAVGIVADGCGSTPFSEFGSRWGAYALDLVVREELQKGGVDNLSWFEVTQKVTNRIIDTADCLGPIERVKETIKDLFLFTLVGFIMADDKIVFFSFGDGAIYINGEHFDLNPEETNAPEFIAYNATRKLDRQRNFNVVKEVPLAELEHFMIATDGILHLRENADEQLSEMNRPCGGPEQFWEDDKFFKDAFDTVRVTKRLNAIADRTPYGSFKGFLPDDTTVIVGKRKPKADPENSENEEG